MTTNALATIALTSLLNLSMASTSEARGYHGHGRGSRGHPGHGNHFRAVRFEGRVFNRWPSEQERLESSPAVIAAVQRSLRIQGAYRGPVNGQLTPATRQAISRFQGSDGLRNTGRIDGFLVSGLGLEFDARQ